MREASGASAARRGAAHLLAAVLVVAALLTVLAGMHASMVQGTTAGASSMTMAAPHGEVASSPVAGASESAPHPDDGTGMLDCLMLGMLCVLAVVALVAAVVLLAALRRLLRPRVAARSLRSALAHLRVPDPPTPLLLSISRT